MNNVNIDYCEHCVKYVPTTYKKITDDNITRVLIACKNQDGCPYIRKQLDSSLHKYEGLLDFKQRETYIMNSDMSVRELYDYIDRCFKNECGYIILTDNHNSRNYYSYHGADSPFYLSSRITASFMKKFIKSIHCKRDGLFVMYIITI